MKLYKLSRIRGRVTAARYGNPGRALSIIVVMGEYGKTTTSKLLAAILEQGHRKVKTYTNDQPAYSPTIEGVQRALFFAKKDGYESAIIEASDEMIRSGALMPLSIDCLVITSLTDRLPLALSLVPKHVVAPSEADIPSGLVEPYKRISFGDDETAEAKIDNVKLYRKGTEVAMTIDHQTKLELATYLGGYANAYNIAAATAAGYVLAVDLEAVREGCADVEEVWGNFVTIESDTPYQVITDGAHSSVSVKRAIESAKTFTKRRLIVVLGDFDIDQAAVELAPELADRCFIVAGDKETQPGVDSADSADLATERALRSAKKDDLVLLLGRVFTIKTDDGRLYAESLMGKDEPT